MNQRLGGLSRYILNIIYKTLFPLKCESCTKEGSFLCGGCESQLQNIPIIGQNCMGCARPSPGGFTHGSCNTPIERLISCFRYEAPISNLIITGKYSFIPEIFTYFSDLATQYFRAQGLDFKSFTICPIPLSSQRQRWRGFNQSAIFGQILSQSFSLPYCEYLVRHRNTKTQKDLSRLERQKNMENCFSIKYPEETNISGKFILLVDDVATTGATLKAAAQTLIRAGAGMIWALTIARD